VRDIHTSTARVGRLCEGKSTISFCRSRKKRMNENGGRLITQSQTDCWRYSNGNGDASEFWSDRTALRCSGIRFDMKVLGSVELEIEIDSTCTLLSYTGSPITTPTFCTNFSDRYLQLSSSPVIYLRSAPVDRSLPHVLPELKSLENQDVLSVRAAEVGRHAAG
jgi:hypothetical protein